MAVSFFTGLRRLLVQVARVLPLLLYGYSVIHILAFVPLDNKACRSLPRLKRCDDMRLCASWVLVYMMAMGMLGLMCVLAYGAYRFVCDTIVRLWELTPVQRGPSGLTRLETICAFFVFAAGVLSGIFACIHVGVRATRAQIAYHMVSPVDFVAIIMQPIFAIIMTLVVSAGIVKDYRRSTTSASTSAEAGTELTEGASMPPGYTELPDAAAGELHLQQNKWGEHEEPDTGMVFDLTTKAVRGKMNRESGTVDPLTDEDIAVCKRRGWSYTTLVRDARAPPVLIT